MSLVKSSANASNNSLQTKFPMLFNFSIATFCSIDTAITKWRQYISDSHWTSILITTKFKNTVDQGWLLFQPNSRMIKTNFNFWDNWISFSLSLWISFFSFSGLSKMTDRVRSTSIRYELLTQLFLCIKFVLQLIFPPVTRSLKLNRRSWSNIVPNNFRIKVNVLSAALSWLKLGLTVCSSSIWNGTQEFQ